MEDEAWLEEEIARELEAIGDANLTDETDDTNNSLSDDGDAQEQVADGSTKGEEDEVLASMQEYISKLQSQSALMDAELAECDQLLHEADIVSARNAPDEELERLAREEGVTVDELRQQVLRTLEEEEKAEQAELMTEVAMDTVTDLLSSAQVSARAQGDTIEDSDMGAFLTALQPPHSSDRQRPIDSNASNHQKPTEAQAIDQTAPENVLTDMQLTKADDNKPGLHTDNPDGDKSPKEQNSSESEAGVVSIVYEHEVLERQLNQEVREMEQRRKALDAQRIKEQKEFREVEEERSRQLDEKRQQQLHVIKQEEDALHEKQEQQESALRKEAEQLQKQIEMSLEEYEAEINELARQAEKEKAEFEASMAEEAKKREQKRAKAAITIQTRYRGYRVRRDHKAEVTSAVSRARERVYEEKLAVAQQQLDERDEKIRIEKEEKEMKEREEEERKRKEEELKQQKIEEERQRKEEEKRRKEEEKQRKEEEKKRKAEEERQRKEEEKRKKEEEKRRKEEEKRRKEEEERQRKEEEKRRKEEEKRKKEEEQRLKKEAERKAKEEKEKKEKEEREQKEKEEREKKEKEEREKKEKEEQERIKNEKENLMRSSVASESQNKSNIDIVGEKVNVEKRGMTEFFIDSVARANSTEPGEQPNTHSTNKTPRPPSAKKPDSTFERPVSGKRKVAIQNADKNQVNGDVRTSHSGSTNHITDASNVHNDVIIVAADNTRQKIQNQNEMAESRNWGEFLPQPIDDARINWIGKQCKSLSKIVSESKTARVIASKKPMRRPASAKSLQPLDEQLLLSAARGHSLKTVTTVELADLPGCSLKTLAQCSQLKTLSMVRCQLITTEGLEQCKQLQYVCFKKNRLELLSLKDLTSLLYADLSHNALSSIHGLDGCTDLRYLDLSHNRITRLGGLSSLKQLHTLNTAHNQLITSRDLAEAPSIQCLDLSHNHLQGIDGLENLALLQSLTATGNNLMQVPKLTNQVLLHTCVLSDNSISFLSSLTQTWLPMLSNLNLSQNSISSLDPMLHFLLLENLDLSHNQLADVDQLVSPFRATRYLLTLNLAGNPVCADSQYSAKLRQALPFLEKLNDSCVKNENTSIERTQFEQMCMAQTLQVQQLDRAYQAAISKLSCPLAKAAAHRKFFTTSHVMATDMRYTHEYGITMVTPKDINLNFDDVTADDVTSFSNSPENDDDFIVKNTPKSVSSSTGTKNIFGDALNKSKAGGIQTPKSSNTSMASSKNAFDAMLASKNESKNAFDAMVSSSNNSKNAFDNALSGRQSVNLEIARQSPAPLDAKLSFEANLMKSMTNTNTKATKQAQVQSHDMKSRFEAMISQQPSAKSSQNGIALQGTVNGIGRSLVNGTSHQNEARASRSFDTNVTTSKVMQLLASSGGDYSRLFDYSATRIQACWRGYILRKRLALALSYAKFDDLDDDLENFDEEVDLGDFDFNMDDLDADLLVPDTPQMPKHHAVLGKPPSHKPQIPPLAPPTTHNQAWRGADSALSDLSARLTGRGEGGATTSGRPPLPPLSRLSDAHTYDSKATSRTKREKEEKIAEDWGFKDNKTAEMMLQRAKKLKYNAMRKKKISQLDPRQRLELLRRLEEGSRVKVPATNKHTMPRKEYFQAREQEVRRAELEQQQARRDKVATHQDQHARTFEWVHTQVNPQYDVASSRIHPSKTGDLPRIDPTVIAGGRAMLAGSPASMDVESLGSASTIADPVTKPQRLWKTNQNKDDNRRLSSHSAEDRLPPIKTGSASSGKSNERMSFRNPKTDMDVGWGGGRRRSKVKH